MKVVIYSDGGADPNPGVGGWAAVLRYGQHEKVLTGNDPHTTNNRMELQAALSALSVLSRPCEVEFYTDSEYLRRGITEWIDQWIANDWQRGKGNRPVQNEDLWRELHRQTRRHQIEWHWVKGHAGDPTNELVDRLARQAREAITTGPDLAADTLRLFVRSSCKGNPGPGGWGAVLEDGPDTTQASGWEPKTTNNRMELTAVLEGLRLVDPGSTVQLFTTSDYLYQGATNWIQGWRKRNWQKKDGQPVANADLWQQLTGRMAEYKLVWVNAKGDQPDNIARPLKEAGLLASSAAETAVAESG